MRRLRCALLVASLTVAVVAVTGRLAAAAPFTINAALTGDFRPENPDNLLVNVMITGDTTSDTTDWIVDLNSALFHPDMKLGTFAFNLAGVDFDDLTIESIDPGGWTFESPANNVPGSGGADFFISANSPSPSNVTNSVNLAFSVLLATGPWDPAMFLDAPLSTGGGIPDPGAQLGAHLQALEPNAAASGFASGNFESPARVPEPITLLLLGIGLVGITVGARRIRRA